MAVDTPVLERISGERKTRECAVPSRMDFLAEDEHNARIKDTYARLINPENKIEDVFPRAQRKEAVVEETKAQAVVEEQPAVRHSITGNHPYVVENARADAAIFRADSAINAKKEQAAEVAQPAAVATPAEEESEDLRPTPTTIQYQTIGMAAEKKTVSSIFENSARTFGKREKIIVAVFVAVVIALVALVIINSAIINNLNAEIAHVQDSITTVRGAIAGVNSTVEDIIFNGMSH